MFRLQRLSFPIIVYFLGLSLLGLCLMPGLSVSGSATQTRRHITVSFRMPGQSPLTVEQSVTAPLEGVLNRIPGIVSVESVSRTGSGSVTLLLDEHADPDAVRFEVATQIRQIHPQLPEGVSYPQLSQAHAASQRGNSFISLYLYTDGPIGEAVEWVNRRLCPYILQVKGVEDIFVSGEKETGLILTYDIRKLLRAGVSAEEIQRALQAHSGRTVMGYANTQNAGKQAFHLDRTTERVQDIILTSESGRSYRLKDLVNIEKGEIPPSSYMRINGRDVLQISIQSKAGSNLVVTGMKVREQLEKVREAMPGEFHLITAKDDSLEMGQELVDVSFRSIASVLILLLLIYITSRSLKYIGVIFLSVASTICTAFICYRYMGVEIHLYSIVGITISLGMIIDNIVVTANHLLYRGKLKIFLSILASTLTTIASLTLIFLLEEFEQKNLWDFAVIMIINLSVSLCTSLFLTPALMQGFQMKKVAQPERKWLRLMARANHAYSSYILHARQHRGKIALLLSLLFGWPVFLIPHHLEGEGKAVEIANTVLGGTVRGYVDRIVGGSLYYFVNRTEAEADRTPGKETYDMYAAATLPEGSGIEEADSVMRRMEDIVARHPGNFTYNVRVQAGSGILYVRFPDKDSWKMSASKMKEILTKEAMRIGNATWSVSGPGKGFSNHQGADQRQFYIRFSGYNYDRMIQYIHQWGNLLTSRYTRIRDLSVQSDLFDENHNREYYYQIQGKERQNMEEFFHVMKEQMPPASTLHLKTGEEEIPVWIKTERGSMPDHWTLEHRLVRIGDHTRRIAHSVSVESRQILPAIKKKNQSYTAILAFNYLGDYSHACEVVGKETKAYAKQLPEGYTIEDLTQQPRGRKHIASFPWFTLCLVTGVIYIICAILFNSLAYPLLIILSIPLSYIGMFVGFGLFHLPMGQGGIASFVLLSGLTCNTIIFLLSDYTSLRREGNPFLRAYLKAFQGKLVPICITALSTAMGFVPFMWDAQIHTFWFSLSIGIVFGLLFSLPAIFLFLPLFIFDSLYKG